MLDKKDEYGKFSGVSSGTFLSSLQLDNGVEIGTGKVSKIPGKTCWIAGYKGIYTVIARSDEKAQEIEKKFGSWGKASYKIIERYRQLQLI